MRPHTRHVVTVLILAIVLIAVATVAARMLH